MTRRIGDACAILPDPVYTITLYAARRIFYGGESSQYSANNTSFRDGNTDANGLRRATAGATRAHEKPVFSYPVLYAVIIAGTS